MMRILFQNLSKKTWILTQFFVGNWPNSYGEQIVLLLVKILNNPDYTSHHNNQKS